MAALWLWGKYAFVVALGLGSGVLIAGAVFAFITAIGVVTRLAQKTGTKRYIKLYEEAIIFGGVFGATTDFIDYNIPLPLFIIAALALLCGVFYGVLAASLAEVMDMIPILTRRVRLQKGMFWFIAAMALGKAAGSILHSVVEGFPT